MRLSRPIRIIGGIAALLVALVAAVVLYAPAWIQRSIEEKTGDALGRAVAIQSMEFLPTELRVRINGLSISGVKGGKFVDAPVIDVSLGWQTLTRFMPVVDQLTVSDAKISIARLDGNRYDFSDIVDRLLEKPKDSSPVNFVLRQLNIEGGAIDFDDRPVKKHHEVRELRLRVPFLSNLPDESDVNVEPVFTGKVNGAAVDLSARLKPFKDPLGASLKLEFSNFDLTRYLEYSPVPLRVKVASGLLDGHLDIEVTSRKETGTVLEAKGLMTLSHLDLREPGGAPLLSLAQAKIRFSGLDPFAPAVSIASAEVEGLDVRVLRKAGGFNLDALRPAPSAPPAGAPEKPPAAAKFRIDELNLHDAKISYADETVQPVFRSVASGISLSIRGLDSEPGSKAQIDLALATGAGESATVQATLALQPFSLEARVAAEKIALGAYAPYLAPYLNADLQGLLSGTANVSAASAASGLQLALNTVALRASGLKLSQSGSEVLRLAALAVNAAQIDPAKRAAIGVTVKLSDGHLAVKRDAGGRLNLAGLLRESPATATAARADTVPWSIDLLNAQVDSLGIDAEDAMATPPVRMALAPLSLTADGLSTRNGVQGRVSLKTGVNRTGTLSAAGPLSLAPFAATLAVSVKDVAVPVFEPYYRQWINARIASGLALVNGTLQIRSGPEGPLFSYSGDAGLDNFRLMDAASSEPLFNVKALRFSGVEASSQPFALQIGPVSAADFYARIEVLPDGRINLQNVVPAKPPASVANRPDPAAAPGTTSSPAAPLRIGTLTLQGGTIEFSDRKIKPEFSMRLADLGGSVAGLSSDPQARARVALRGMVGGYAPLDIEGTVNPLSRNLFLDIKAKAKGIDLNPFTPYSGRYVGYGIEKGKMSIDLAYHIENDRLDAKHKIFLDQLTFGEPVDSPDAVKLPVLLAVALLKNSKGEIELELPVEGSLEDPQFSVGAIIAKLIGNLIVKAVTAPFALLGAIFGGGEDAGDLSYLEFSAGSAAISAAAESKLKTLSKALADRTGVRLEIAGRTDAARDLEGLRRASLMRKLRALKAEAGGTGEVTPEEYPALLQTAYGRESFAKPRNALGIALTLPVPEMEKLIFANIGIGEPQMRQLANRRVDTVRSWLMKSGGVDAGRMYLIEPRDGEGADRTGASASRVDLYVK